MPFDVLWYERNYRNFWYFSFLFFPTASKDNMFLIYHLYNNKKQNLESIMW